MIDVIVADDHHLVREALRSLLERTDDIKVIGEAEDGLDAVEQVERLAPDVVIMDIGMPRLNGALATERISNSSVKTQVVILSMYSDEVIVRQTMRKGARGYVLKSSVAAELLLAIRAAYREEIYLSPSVSSYILDGFLAHAAESENSERLTRLTSRENEVLQLIAEGYTNTQIARELTLSTKTVEKHRTNLMGKLDIHNVAGLVRYAMKHRLVATDE